MLEVKDTSGPKAPDKRHLQEFVRRAPRIDPQFFTQARDETLELNLRIAVVEREIDERVAALYGVPLDKQD